MMWTVFFFNAKCEPTFAPNLAHAHLTKHFVSACLAILFKLFNSKRSMSLCAWLFLFYPSIHPSSSCTYIDTWNMCWIKFQFQRKPTIGLQFCYSFLLRTCTLHIIIGIECDNSLVLLLNTPYFFLSSSKFFSFSVQWINK